MSKSSQKEQNCQFLKFLVKQSFTFGRLKILLNPLTNSAALSRHTGQEEGEATSHLWSRLGILLQRGNAAILGNRVPSLPGPQIDGIL